VLQPRPVGHEVGPAAPLGLPLLADLVVLALQVAALGDDDDSLTQHGTLVVEAAHDRADQLFAAAIGVVGAGVYEVHTLPQGEGQRLVEDAAVNIDPVAAKTGRADQQAGLAQRAVGDL